MLTSLIVVACLAILAWLNGRLVGVGAGQVVLYTVLGLALVLLGLVALAGLNLAADPSVLGPWGYAAVWGAVTRGFLVVLPFTLLALLTELVYGWQAAPAFIQASIMTSGAAAGAELMRQAGRKTRYLVVSMIVAFVFCTAWAVFSYVFQKVAG
jgi:hypothetical protein